MAMETDLYLRALRTRGWIIAAMVVASLAAAFVFTARQTPVYRAVASSTVTPSAQIKETAELLRSLETLERRTLVATFALLAGSRETRHDAATAIGLGGEDLALYRVSASVAPNANVIRIQVEGADANRVSELANAVTQVTAAKVSQLYPLFAVQPLDAAIPSPSPAYPNGKRNAAVAVIIGLFVGLAGAVGLEVLASFGARAEQRNAERPALAA